MISLNSTTFQTLTLSTPQNSSSSSPYILIVSLNRPEKRNAIDSLMWHEIKTLFRLIGTTGDDHRCVILTGNGKSFCSGLDTTDKTLTSPPPDNCDDVARQILSFRTQIAAMQDAFTALQECPIPVIAAIHGACIGAGVDFICAADIRLCSPSAIFGIREVKLGLAPDVGTLQRFPKIVGCDSLVRELCFTGRNFDARMADRIGFVSRISDTEEGLLDMALGVCEEICGNSPVAVAVAKESLNYSRDHAVKEGLLHVATINAGAILTKDLGLGTDAGVEFERLLPHSRL